MHLIIQVKRRSDFQPQSRPPTHPLEQGLTTLDLATRIRQNLYEAKTYARWRRKSWRVMASGTHLLGLAVSATATVILGLAELNGPAQWGFIFSALVTTLTAIEPFFNWRARWVFAEEALAEWHRIDSDLTMYVASTETNDLDRSKVLGYHDECSKVWEQFSGQWLEQRKPKATPSAS
ncbi:SLATT domain-containing protein [Arthrobacter sp. S39]|uniref:SLATT domain-containing protein n=1 Tax=Arthrobacter sp. S39 TaxID=2509720 RepID=UPI00103722E8|nr:SLATT domain-containing protein [Arthrobacter sp. S39]TAP44617.1 SLATT domain-containing protein [Arthrobacter sp. S39]